MTIDDQLKSEKVIAYQIMGYAYYDIGLPILRVMEIGAASVYDKRLKDSFLYIRDELEGGIDVSEAMRKKGFPFEELEIKEIEKGERSGELDIRLKGLAKKLILKNESERS
jgi:type IV pilus assembly protein PilC